MMTAIFAIGASLTTASGFRIATGNVPAFTAIVLLCGFMLGIYAMLGVALCWAMGS